jgi:hypothetical protein
MCEGMPCFTAQDRADIDVELEDAKAERDDAEVVFQAAQQDYWAKSSVVMTLEMEKSNAEMNQCPC